jgi:hypothetical protein
VLQAVIHFVGRATTLYRVASGSYRAATNSYSRTMHMGRPSRGADWVGLAEVRTVIGCCRQAQGGRRQIQ